MLPDEHATIIPTLQQYPAVHKDDEHDKLDKAPVLDHVPGDDNGDDKR